MCRYYWYDFCSSLDRFHEYPVSEFRKISHLESIEQLPKQPKVPANECLHLTDHCPSALSGFDEKPPKR